MSGSMFPADHSGVWGLVLGLIGLVLFAVTISLFIDGDFTLRGMGGNSDAGELEEQEATLIALGLELERLQRAEQERGERDQVTADLQGTIRRIATAAVNTEELEAAIQTQREWIEKSSEEHEDYQLAYRDWLWQNAAQRSFDSLETKDGKVYRIVTITKVSAAELRIRHETGTANLPVILLPKDLREELQLDLTEAQRIIRARRQAEIAALEERQAARQVVAPPVARSPGRSTQTPSRTRRDRIESPPADANRLEILTLHEQVASLTNRLSLLRTELAEARMNAVANRRHRSAPGSLETWEERVVRLTNIQIRAEAKLNVLRARLQAIDPGDRPPLTR